MKNRFASGVPCAAKTEPEQSMASPEHKPKKCILAWVFIGGGKAGLVWKVAEFAGNQAGCVPQQEAHRGKARSG